MSTMKDRAARSRWTMWGVLALAAGAIAWRAPIVWWEARFWGEEGTLYFAYARQQGVLASLFFVPTSGFPAGYFLLAASLPATVASFFSLELAPRITTFFAFLWQLMPLSIVLFGASPLWPGRARRILVCSVLVFAPAVVGEVWLNTINSQVFCGLTAVLILVSEKPEGRYARLYRALLVFCGLSGPYTSFLAPVFWLKTRMDRSAETILQWRIVLVSALLQASVFLWATATFPLAPERFEAGRWALRVAAAAYHFVIRSLFGESLGLEIAELLGLRQPLGTIADAYWLPVKTASIGDVGVLIGWIGLVVMASVLIWLGRRAHPWAHLLTAALVVSGMLITVSIGHLYVAGRYAVVPGTLLLLRVAVASWEDGPDWRRWSARLVLALGLLAGLISFRGESPPGVFGLAPGRPSWTAEVEAWRENPAHELRIWAYNLDIPNRLLLSPAPTAGVDLRAIEAQPFEQISTGDWATWRAPTAEMPMDFRLVFDFEISRPLEEVEVEVRWLDPRRRVAAVWPIESCASFEAGLRFCRVILERQDLRSLEGWRGQALDGVEIALRSARARPTRLAVTRLRLARRLEGALEPLLAGRRSSEDRERREKLAGEATAVAAAESWRLDGDLSFDSRDLERVRARWAPGTRVELKRQGDRLTYRESSLFAVLGGTLAGGEKGLLRAVNLVAALAVLLWARRRGAELSWALPALLASWAGVALFSPGATWILVLALWIGLTLGREIRLPNRWLGAALIGALSALMILESPIFLPLALVPIIDHHRRRRDLRLLVISLLISGLCLASAHQLVTAAGGAPWWSEGEGVVLAREAFEPDEQRPLVIPEARASQRGIAASTEPLWAMPEGFFGPLFAYPLLLIWLWVGVLPWRAGKRLEFDGWIIPVALGAAAGLSWFLSPHSRAGPQAWAILYPLLLLLPFDWPAKARRAAQLVAALWVLAVLRAFL